MSPLANIRTGRLGHVNHHPIRSPPRDRDRELYGEGAMIQGVHYQVYERHNAAQAREWVLRRLRTRASVNQARERTRRAARSILSSARMECRR
jgi:hypothetical protein